MEEVNVSVARIELGRLVEQVHSTGTPVVIVKGRRGQDEDEIRVKLVPIKTRGRPSSA